MRKRSAISRHLRCERCGRRCRDCRHGDQLPTEDSLDLDMVRRARAAGHHHRRRIDQAVLRVLGGL